MQRINEIKSIMRQLKDSKATTESLENVKLVTESEDTETENDTSNFDLIIAKLEDILSRFEKVIAAAEGAANDDTPAEDEAEEPAEDEAEEPAPEDEEAAEESYTRSLERRIEDLERRFTESRRRSACRRFTR